MKPSEFYIGVISFFSILVPGAVATAVLEPLLRNSVLGPVISVPEGAAGGWAVFLVTSYFLGHLIFFVGGAYIDPLYDKIRRRRNPYTNESAYQCATNLRRELLKGSENDAISTFQWARAILTAEFSAAAGHIYELEAESKFFRSLLVVLSLSGIVLLVRAQWIEGIVAFVLVGACFGRYYERRLKSTTQAYIYIITLYRLGKLGSAVKESPSLAPVADV